MTYEQRLKKRALDLGHGHPTKVFTEEGGQQNWLTQMLRQDHVRVEGVTTGGMDKRERLGLLAQAIRSGKILFPKKGSDRQTDHLVEQITGFGMERHDDLMDAFSLVGNKIRPLLEGRTIGMTVNDPRTGEMKIAKADDLEQEIQFQEDTMEKALRYFDAFQYATGRLPLC
jgi:hypothetical protein